MIHRLNNPEIAVYNPMLGHNKPNVCGQTNPTCVLLNIDPAMGYRNDSNGITFKPVSIDSERFIIIMT